MICPFCNIFEARENHHVFSRKQYPKLKNIKKNKVRICHICHLERLHNHKTFKKISDGEMIILEPLTNNDIKDYMRYLYGSKWETELMKIDKAKKKFSSEQPILGIPKVYRKPEWNKSRKNASVFKVSLRD